MKRITYSVLIPFVFMYIMSASVFAESQTTVYVEQKQNENRICYTVSISEDSQIAAFEFEVTYDKEKLIFDSTKELSLFENGIGRINDSNAGKIVGVFICAASLDEQGEFVEFAFTKAEGAELEAGSFELSVNEIADQNGKNIDYEISYIGFPEAPHEVTEEQKTEEKTPLEQESEEKVTSKPESEEKVSSDKQTETEPSVSENKVLVENEKTNAVESQDIGSYSFSGCSSLESISIPENVTQIANSAFFNCTSLSDIVLPENLELIGVTAFFNTAFYNDKNNWSDDTLYLQNYLLEVDTNYTDKFEVKKGTTVIAGGALYYCYYVTSVIIPDSVKYIGLSAFANCESLTDIYYYGAQEQFDAISIDSYNDYFTNANLNLVDVSNILTGAAGGNATYSYNIDTGVLTLTGSGTLWSGIPSADENASYRDAVKEIVVEKGFTAIGGNVFGNGKYPNVVKVTLPDGITSIGDSAFHNCTKLSEINIPEGVKTIGTWAFYADNRLQNITFPSTLESIGEYAFYGVYIDSFNYSSTRDAWDNVTVAETGNERLAFTVCTDDTATLLDTGDTILIFNEDSETLYISGTMYTGDFTADSATHLVSNDIAEKVKHIVLDRTVAGFGSYSFVNLTNLETVTGGENMRYLGIWAFKGLSKLTTVEFTSAEYFGVLCYGAFSDCSSLDNVVLSDALVTLGGAAYRNCTSLTSITVPAKVEGIGDNTFNGCTALETVVVEGARATRENSFNGCTALKSVTFSEGFTTIDEWAFSGARIAELNLPSTLTTVGDYAFYWGIPTTVNFAGSEAQWNAITFGTNNEHLTNLTINFGA